LNVSDLGRINAVVDHRLALLRDLERTSKLLEPRVSVVVEDWVRDWRARRSFRLVLRPELLAISVTSRCRSLDKARWRSLILFENNSGLSVLLGLNRMHRLPDAEDLASEAVVVDVTRLNFHLGITSG